MMKKKTNKPKGSAATDLLWVLLLTAVLCSCAAANLQGQFDETARAYGIALRWKNFETAETFAAASIRDQYEKRLKDARGVEVVDYQVVNVEYDGAKKKAVVSAEISYSTRSSNRVRKLLDKQVWSYGDSQGSNQWRLMTLLPEFQ